MSLANQGKRNRNIPSFEDVGTPEIKETPTPQPADTKKSVVAGTNTNTNNGIDLNAILPEETKILKKQVSIYLDLDVIEALNAFGEARGKGAKSDLVNNFLKQAFNIRQGNN